MKRRYYIILQLLIVVSLLHPAFAQKKSKEEKALSGEWKKKMSAMDPLEFKRIMEERDSLLKQISTLEESQAQYRSQLEEKDKVIDSLKKEVESVPGTGVAPLVENNKMVSSTTDTKIDSTRVDTSSSVTLLQPSASVNNKTAGKRTPSKGIVYKVQIGIFKNKNLEKYIYNNKFFGGDVDQDGARKYTLGYFTDYWEADNFKKYMRAMGVNDAWIVAYKDGNRVNIKDALEGVL